MGQSGQESQTGETAQTGKTEQEERKDRQRRQDGRKRADLNSEQKCTTSYRENINKTDIQTDKARKKEVGQQDSVQTNSNCSDKLQFACDHLSPPSPFPAKS
jgi:hypothetical protein